MKYLTASIIAVALLVSAEQVSAQCLGGNNLGLVDNISGSSSTKKPRANKTIYIYQLEFISGSKTEIPATSINIGQSLI